MEDASPPDEEAAASLLVEDTPDGDKKEDDNNIVEEAPESATDEKDGLLKTSTDRPDSYPVYEWLKTTYAAARLPAKYQLATEHDALKRSMSSVRFTVMCSAINTKMLNPNYPIMVTPDAHPDSFPDTEPFNYNSATYFLPMCSLLGVAIASIFLGTISDKMGRKKVLLVLAWISAVGSVVKYFTSNTFWGFCATQFVFGFFLGNLPVGMAYVGDVYTTKKEKEKELGLLVSYYVIGNSGGGIIAILMNGSGLFAPLWVGAGMLAFAAIYTSWYMIEAGDVRLQQNGDDMKDGLMKHKNEEDDVARPETIDQKACWNIIGGAVADNFGSTGLFPLCLSPLAIEQYLFDFVDAGEEPIMSIEGYQWLSVCVAFMVVPSTVMTPHVFKWLGVAGTCVAGNLMTAAVTFALLMIGNGAATTGMFGLFVFVMYGGFPFTVFSQLTTGPMLDVIAPIDKIGYVQGLNNAAMNFGMAIAPWVFGIIADATNANLAISIGIGISILAAAINAPLTCDSRFGRQKTLPPQAKRVLSGEDEGFVQSALDGAVVDQEAFMKINFERIKNGQSAIVPRVKPYAEEKGTEEMQKLYDHAEEAFETRMEMNDRILTALNDPTRERNAEELCDLLNYGIYSDAETAQEARSDLGQWVGDYLDDAGYNPHTTSVMIKQMIINALPPIKKEKEFTPENIEGSLIRAREVLNRHLELRKEEDKKQWSYAQTLGTAPPVFYS
mmetsp:Transcript_50181/g.76356  ORF Transcript_50181/g.76356 Transcript_50181/m.76356 type:complete len:724 (+) Transcript_50181:93-2264(+)